MLKRALLITAVVFLMISTAGCFNKKVKIEYINIPEKIIIKGNIYKEEIDDLNARFKKLKEAKGKPEDLEKIMNRIIEFLRKSSLEVDDKKFIEKVIDDIEGAEGIIEGIYTRLPRSSQTFNIDFIYENMPKQIISNNPSSKAAETDYVENLKQGYVPNITVFSDGTTLIPRYDKRAPSKVVLVKILLDKETVNYISDFYNSNI